MRPTRRRTALLTAVAAAVLLADPAVASPLAAAAAPPGAHVTVALPLAPRDAGALDAAARLPVASTATRRGHTASPSPTSRPGW